MHSNHSAVHGLGAFSQKNNEWTTGRISALFCATSTMNFKTIPPPRLLGGTGTMNFFAPGRIYSRPYQSLLRLHSKKLCIKAFSSLMSETDRAEDSLLGPAAEATLLMLHWKKLCEHVANFSSTHAGRRACLSLSVPLTTSESEALIEETRAMSVLE